MAATALMISAGTIGTAADAAVLTVDVTGRQTFDLFQDTSNTVLLFNIGAGSLVTSLTFDLTIATVSGSGSYLSEAAIYYTDSPVTDGVVFRPGIADANSGTATYTGTSDLVALGLDFAVGANGLLRIEFAESFDDLPNAADATFTRGTLAFTYTPLAGAVPEPASWALMIAGFGLVGGAMRRRQRVSVSYA